MVMLMESALKKRELKAQYHVRAWASHHHTFWSNAMQTRWLLGSYDDPCWMGDLFISALQGYSSVLMGWRETDMESNGCIWKFVRTWIVGSRSWLWPLRQDMWSLSGQLLTSVVDSGLLAIESFWVTLAWYFNTCEARWVAGESQSEVSSYYSNCFGFTQASGKGPQRRIISSGRHVR